MGCKREKDISEIKLVEGNKMKKILVSFLILIFACAAVFATSPYTGSSVYLEGKIEKGYLPNPPTDGGDETTDEGLTVRLIFTENDASSVDWTNGYAPSEYYNDVSNPRSVDLLGTEESGIKNITLHYGVYGNVGSNDNPNIKIQLETVGWKFNDNTTDTVYLNLDTTKVPVSECIGKASAVENSADKHTSSIQIMKNKEGAQSEIIEIGTTKITWGVVEGKTPNAGDYTATVTITVNPEP